MSRCLWCGGLVEAPRPEPLLCPACAEHFRPLDGGYCPLCGQVFASADPDVTPCAACRRAPPPWSRLGFLGLYTGLVREAILAFKYQPSYGYAGLMQSLAWQIYQRHIAPDHPEIIVPVPMSMDKLRRRGFNQSLELARRLHVPGRSDLAPSALLRVRSIPAQTGLSRKARRENAKGAYAADTEQVEDRHALLVDDVYTTGATLEACTLALYKAGASRVDVLVVARAMDLH